MTSLFDEAPTVTHSTHFFEMTHSVKTSVLQKKLLLVKKMAQLHRLTQNLGCIGIRWINVKSSTFQPTDGWLSRTLKREGIKSVSPHGQSKEVCEWACSDWLSDVWHLMRQNYSDDEVINMDETALYFNAQHSRTFVTTEDDRKPVKVKKDRWTVLPQSWTCQIFYYRIRSLK